MKGFIEEVAHWLYDRYGDQISDINILFPSRRARLFFSDALSHKASRPIWQPNYTSVDNLMQEIAGVTQSNDIKLITELFKVYSRYHNESFDKFYYWGEMLLSDFDSIDKYLIDAEHLFANIRDLKELEGDYSYLTEDQIRIINQFWKNFGLDSIFSKEKESFMTIWTSLPAIYRDYKQTLTTSGLAYTGMIHRNAANKIQKGEALQPLDNERYVVIGFNALSECEKILFKRLYTGGKCDFFWDYDNYYVNNQENEAGLFLRENLRNFPEPDGFSHRSKHNYFAAPKQITSVSAPSNALQCKHVHTFLENLMAKGETLDKRTAVVLTDESLLLPVLYSIPESVTSINVTMGYPLRQTTAYTFIERLIELQNRCRNKGHISKFYHSDVIGLLNHPYIINRNELFCKQIIDQINTIGQIYIPQDVFKIGGIIESVFSPCQTWEDVSKYISDIIRHVCSTPYSSDYDQHRDDFFAIITDKIDNITNSLLDSGVVVTIPIFVSLIRRILQQVNIPYSGEPLEGVQIMGILETRSLDFDNVIILSMNDDTFPGNRSVSSSFIPYNLRLGYNLPTPQHHEGVYAYYFYRLIQRAKRIEMVYCSRSDDKRTGEPSRYIYQLMYESGHKIKEKNILLDINFSTNNGIEIQKDQAIIQTLESYLKGGNRKLSPSSYNNYIECPLKFYFKSVAGIKSPEELTEEVDMSTFGTILHKTMELLYAPIISENNPQDLIRKMIGSDQVKNAIDRALSLEYFHTEHASDQDYGGNIILISEIIERYINHSILPYDASRDDFAIIELEKEVESEFSFTVNNRELTVCIGGKADRIDSLSDGKLRVVDYKSGTSHLDFKSIEALFSDDSTERSSAAIQTLMYSLILSNSRDRDVQPALYYIRQMNNKTFSPLLNSGGVKIESFSNHKELFTCMLASSMSQLYDYKQPFRQCSDIKTCIYCDYNRICKRE